jgi:transposase
VTGRLCRRAQDDTQRNLASADALAAVRRIDAPFDIERQINGRSADQRSAISDQRSDRAVRQDLSAPLVAELGAWMRKERARLSRHNDLAQAIDYMHLGHSFT